VIGVAANELAGRTIGGRVSAVNGRNITLDRAADVKAGNRLFLNHQAQLRPEPFRPLTETS
jgi:predicted phage tail protein